MTVEADSSRSPTGGNGRGGLPGAGGEGRATAVRDARAQLLRHVEALLEPVMVLLGLVFLGLLVLNYSGLRLTPAEQDAVGRGLELIYGAFVLDFALRWFVTPAKGRFLRQNWLLVLSLVFPAVRPLHAVRALWGLQSGHLLQALTGANRGLQALRRITGGRRFAYLLGLSLVVVVLGAVGVDSFERNAPTADIRSFGEALWWASTLITTINSSDDPVTLEGRLIGLVLRLYALTIFGYLTASIATYFIGRLPTPTPTAAPPAPAADLAGEVDRLRAEVERLRAERPPAGPPAESAAGGAVQSAAGRSRSRRRVDPR